MNEKYAKLENVLEDEVKVYRTLLDLVRREKDILISAKIDDLNETNSTKEKLIYKVKQLEKERTDAAQEFAIVVGANKESVRLLELASRVSDPHSTKLRGLHATLDLLIKRIKEHNKDNEALVHSALKTVNGALGAIKETLQPKNTYAPSGDIKRSGVAGHFVSKDI